MKEHKNQYILRIKEHSRCDNFYNISCVICYSYSVYRYNDEHECRWYELKSLLFDIIEIKNLLETEYKQFPAFIEFKKHSLMTKKNEALPCPQAVLFPVPFIVAILKGEQTNIDDVLCEVVDTFIEKRKNIDFTDLPEEKDGSEKLEIFKTFIDTKPSYNDIFKNEIGKEFEESREVIEIDLDDTSKFQLGKLLNCGAHGAVFTCMYEGREYAIKQCLEADIPSLRKEAFILANCDNPFIIKVKGFCETSLNLCKQEEDEVRKKMVEKKFSPLDIRRLINPQNSKFGYMLMEQCEQKTLQQFISDHWGEDEYKMDDDIIKIIFGQVISSCEYLLKEKRMVHRDLKPENILMKNSESGEPIIKLCDFGFARAIAREMTTRAGSIQFADLRCSKKEQYSSEADLYSLGCILYNLTHGFLAYTEWDENEGDEGDYVECEDLIINEDIDGTELGDLILNLCQKEHTERMSWDEFLENDYVVECLELASDKADDAADVEGFDE